MWILVLMMIVLPGLMGFGVLIALIGLMKQSGPTVKVGLTLFAIPLCVFLVLATMLK